MNHHIRQLIKRYVTFLVGLAVMALAVALMTKAALGISPIQSICYVVYLGFPEHLSLGTLIFCWNCVLFLLQPVILGKRFQLVNLVQLPLSLFFGWTVDGFGAIGIGTLTSGTCVGFIVGFFSRRIAPIVDKFCDSERTGKQ